MNTMQITPPIPNIGTRISVNAPIGGHIQRVEGVVVSNPNPSLFGDFYTVKLSEKGNIVTVQHDHSVRIIENQ